MAGLVAEKAHGGSSVGWGGGTLGLVVADWLDGGNSR